MEEQEILDEIQEATRKLNHYMRLAVTKRLKVECDVDNNMHELNYQYCIPRVSVGVYRGLLNVS